MNLSWRQWQRVGIHPHHGIATPLSALHTHQSCGIGEFYDLIPLIDWCREIGFDLIQLLPLNNAERDASPYTIESSCALNGIYLSLTALPELTSHERTSIATLQQLTRSERVCFHEVGERKFSFLRRYYERTYTALYEKPVEAFLIEQPWLKHYAKFKALKEQFHYTPWKNWPTSQQEDVGTFHFYAFLQYLTFVQFSTLKAHAQKQGVLLIGDLPIFMGQESADTWHHKELFHSSLGAGSPPDVYNKEGQNWQLPLIHWDVISQTEFAWWKQRLQYAANFFDLCRLDHILAFFRIFALPFHASPKEGSYLPRSDQEALLQGEELLSALIPLSSLLLIGEDLGTVPPYVRPCLKHLGICSTKLMRWEREWDTDQRFIPPSRYEPLSLCTVSTHDTETLSLWWQDSPQEARAFAQERGWDYTGELTLAQREEILKESHKTTSLLHVNLLQEYLAAFPELVHASPQEERINTPDQLTPTNWTYRYKKPLEEMIHHEGLKAWIKKLLL